MPIYEYRCASCGLQKEHLQKASDATLVICPHCGNENYTRQLSVAGFQLKGSGWYVTDFKNPAQKSPTAPPPCQGGDGACSPAACPATAS
jgi:putative FmdB family regulatory protein